MTPEQIEEQIQILKNVSEKATASPEAARKFLKDAGIAMDSPSIPLDKLTELLYNAYYILPVQREQLLKDINKMLEP